MRFFSNEAKDNAEDQDNVRTRDDERTQQAEPVVPQQRAGSPWQHGPADADRPVAEPAPQPTAFGASTVGGAVAASAMAEPRPIHNPEDEPDRDRPTDRTTDAASGVADDRTVPLDSRLAETDTRAQEADARTHDQADDRLREQADDLPRESEADRTVTIDTAAQNRVDTGDQDRTVPIGQRPADTHDDVDLPLDLDEPPRGRHTDDSDPAADSVIEDRGTFEDPKVLDEAERTDPVDAAVDDKGTFEDPQVVTAPIPTTETDHSAGPAPFFPTAEVQALKDRWRDVQLRFVDDPKAATGEAAQLVDEAVDRLTAALREQRGSLAKGHDDTEALRVELRAYRDILDRLLGL
ncbi:hypothetical protein AB0C07_04800 [Actinoplanes missouriensis]|uniref:hypothetical protein n=1 Tax=Actinoplanes missouriensis TaxID=1866 RepID=UPI0033EE34B0